MNKIIGFVDASLDFCFFLRLILFDFILSAFELVFFRFCCCTFKIIDVFIWPFFFFFLWLPILCSSFFIYNSHFWIGDDKSRMFLFYYCIYIERPITIRIAKNYYYDHKKNDKLVVDVISFGFSFQVKVEFFIAL